MALSRKKKIIIGVVVAVVLAIVVVISVVATRKEEPEVVTVKVESRPELKQTVTASGEVRISVTGVGLSGWSCAARGARRAGGMVAN